MSGLISKAKEGLAKSKSKADVLKSPTSENIPKIEAKKSENELRWEELVSNINRPLNLCDMALLKHLIICFFRNSYSLVDSLIYDC